MPKSLSLRGGVFSGHLAETPLFKLGPAFWWLLSLLLSLSPNCTEIWVGALKSYSILAYVVCKCWINRQIDAIL